jgi:hypothetical protein
LNDVVVSYRIFSAKTFANASLSVSAMRLELIDLPQIGEAFPATKNASGRENSQWAFGFLGVKDVSGTWRLENLPGASTPRVGFNPRLVGHKYKFPLVVDGHRVGNFDNSNAGMAGIEREVLTRVLRRNVEEIIRKYGCTILVSTHGRQRNAGCYERK